MANIINGDNGVVSGTAGLKSSSDGTGILALQTNGTTAVTVDASQNVGVGTTAPRSKLSVTNGTENTSGDAPQEAIITGANQAITAGLGILTVQSNTAIAADVGATIALGGRIRSTGTTTDASNYAVLKGAKENATSDNSAGYFAISTKPNGVAPVERMRIDSSGNVGIGTTSPIRKLTVSNAGTPEFVLQDTSQATDSKNWRIFNASNTLYLGTLNDAGTAGTDVAKLTSAGLFQFNSGYGSVATAYGCRAWVNFNGTGTVAIRASGNVTSITDNGVGNYTINLTTAMSDVNYSCEGTCEGNGETISVSTRTGRTTTAIPLIVVRMSGGANVQSDNASVNISVHR